MLQKKILGISFGVFFTISFLVNLFNLYEITVGSILAAVLVSLLISIMLTLVVGVVSILFKKTAN